MSAPRSRNDDGVSSVLGAILVFGLLVLTLVTIQVEFVPVWDKERERDQGVKVSNQAGAIKADLDRIALGQVDGTLTEPVSLVRSRGFTFFGNDVLPGTVRFTPTSTGAGLLLQSGNPVAIQGSSGDDLFGLNEDWTWNGTTILNILSVEHLRVRIPNPGGLPTGTQIFTLTAADTNGNCAAQFVLAASGASGVSKAIEIRTMPALVPASSSCDTNATSIDQRYIGNATPSYLYFDPLAGDFADSLSALAPAQYPLRMTFTQGNTGAQVALVYDQATSFGRVRSGASGLVYSSLSESYQTGILTIQLNHQRLDPQTYSFEYGAVILRQPGGAAIISPPGFTVSASLAQASLSWAFPTLSGGSAAVSGAPGATVNMVPAGPAGRQLAAQNLTMRIDTAYPSAWSSFWTERLTLAGLSASSVTPQAPCAVLTASPQYNITTTASTATLNLWGPCSHPTDTTRDVVVTLLAGGAAVELQPSG